MLVIVRVLVCVPPTHVPQADHAPVFVIVDAPQEGLQTGGGGVVGGGGVGVGGGGGAVIVISLLVVEA